jgi:hypothetical protein
MRIDPSGSRARCAWWTGSEFSNEGCTATEFKIDQTICECTVTGKFVTVFLDSLPPIAVPPGQGPRPNPLVPKLRNKNQDWFHENKTTTITLIIGIVIAAILVGLGAWMFRARGKSPTRGNPTPSISRIPKKDEVIEKFARGEDSSMDSSFEESSRTGRSEDEMEIRSDRSSRSGTKSEEEFSVYRGNKKEN